MNPATNKIISEIKKALKSKGIRMEVNACGCCDSPWVQLEVDGVSITGNRSIDYCGFDMFDTKKVES